MAEDIEIINQNTKIEKIKNFFSNNLKSLVGSFIFILGGQPSTTQPIAGPCDSPQVVKRNIFPNVLNDIKYTI